ncbi:MAG: autotransporter-associated beta strand repeat-containing protein, partial [Chthoniobacterales bacterium]
AMSIFNIQTLQTVTLSGNKTLNNATYTVDAGTTTTESGNLSGGGGITKEGTGTLLVTGNNSFTGAVAVNAGLLNLNSSTGGAAATTSSVSVASGATLLISQSNQVSDTAAVSLSGGTIQRGSGVSEVFGNLNLTTGSFLDFGTGTTGTLSFGTYTPSSLLTVQNFLPGNVLTFGSNLTGNIGDIGLFSFDNDFTSSWDGSSTFTITAIPEPSTYLVAAGLLGLLILSARKRSAQSARV